MSSFKFFLLFSLSRVYIQYTIFYLYNLISSNFNTSLTQNDVVNICYECLYIYFTLRNGKIKKEQGNPAQKIKTEKEIVAK